MNPLDIEYYDWLVGQIHIPNGKSYGILFERMHNLEFHWTVPNDNNRLKDGLDLRFEFARKKAKTLQLEGATFLEVVVALSRRLAFVAGGDANRWAWKLLKNIRLTKMNDIPTDAESRDMDEILDAVIWRTYKPSGLGGFFPLDNPAADQTQIEIWYQMQAYVNEMADL